MTPELAGLLGILAGFVLAVVVVLWFHERREFRKADAQELAAVERERRAVERHDLQMRGLNDARALTLAAINQRARLEVRTASLEDAINEHAAHLETLGIKSAARVKAGG